MIGGGGVFLLSTSGDELYVYESSDEGVTADNFVFSMYMNG